MDLFPARHIWQWAVHLSLGSIGALTLGEATTPESIGAAVSIIAERLADLADQCEEGLLKVEELREQLEETENNLSQCLPEESAAFRVFDRGRKQIDQWWAISHSGYVEPSHCRKLSGWRDLVESVLNRVQPVAFASPHIGRTQYFLEAGDLYHAAKIVLRILRRAERELVIVDPYLDGSIFEYLDEIPPEVSVKLITANKKPLFIRLLHQRPATAGCQISARESAESHDRFILVDESELWHLGASINNVGKKAAMLNLVVEPEEKQSALDSVTQWWQSGIQL